MSIRHILLDVFGYFSLDFLSAKVALEDSAVRTEKDDMRYALDTVQFGRDLLGIDDLIPVHSVNLCSILGSLRLVPHRYAEDFEAFLVIFLVDIPDIRDFSLAGSAP